MKNKIFDFIKIFLLSITITQIVNFGISVFMKYEIFNPNVWTFQFTIFSFFISLFFTNFCIFSKKINFLVIGILLLAQSLFYYFGNFYPFYKFYGLSTFLILPNIILVFSLAIFYFIWLKLRLQYARALIYSLSSAIFYGLFFFFGQKFLLPQILHKTFLEYLINGMLIFIAISFSYNFIAIIIAKILPDYRFDNKEKIYSVE